MKTSTKLALGASAAAVTGVAAGAAGLAAFALGRPSEPTNAVLIEDFDGVRTDRIVVSGDGVALHVREWGPADGPVAVLVHGWTCNVGNFPRQVEHLVGRGYRVVTYDQRGHGSSEAGDPSRYGAGVLADDLRAVLADALGESGGTALLVGHSMGAISIMAWAAKYPGEVAQRAHHALLVSTFADRAVPSFVRARGLGVLNRAPRVVHDLGSSVLGRPVRLRHNRLDLGILRYAALCGYASYGAVKYTEDMVSQCPPRIRGAWGRALVDVDVTDGLRALNVPTSVAVGQFDHLTPPVHAERMAAELRLTGYLDRFAVIRDAGHMLPIEQPEKVNNLIDAILGKPVPAPAV
ncbi:alpha/beta hydrolase [Tsukamurella sp. 8F]|uniref:alpha/beta fold hydrolase n=1 Tax=unclassified Tsukamurella TaxID=2633480 RepID=UPI0023B9FB71|nr:MULTISPECIES: alpha/beta hydrolase [unclassified Tsukamurella]MDF0528312.1 alpha/beta hydrolase [Tsukamurella sp. 8J]MDF0586137.1 alpha/beta hydrolase [Tsukamurella sp. 8F]